MLRGIINIILVALHTIFWCLLIYILFLLKLLPHAKLKQKVYALMSKAGNAWIKSNNLLMALTLNIQWEFPALENLSMNQWYFIISNHQSWSDILVLQKLFLGKVPFIRFFVKKQLLWLPFVNIAFFAFDFPILHRHSKETLDAHPELRSQDLLATQKACQKFKLIPVSILNFLEGTRFTPKKHQLQQSPFPHLLKPKAGGFAFAITAMDKLITQVLDVTIIYPEGRKTFWDFLCGKVHRVIVKVQLRDIPPHLLTGNYATDETYRHQFKAWIESLWQEKEITYRQTLP